MTQTRHLLVLLASLTALVLLQPCRALAQGYPSKPVRIIVSYPPGGSVDLAGRLLAQTLQQGMGQAAVVENRPGAGGAIGADVVAKAAPDGHTLLVTASGALTVIPHLQQLPYDPIRSFAPVTKLTTSPLLLSVNAALPIHNVGQLLAYIKSQPGSVNASSTGPGSQSQLAGELLKMMTGAAITVIVYKGGAPAAAAIASGEVPFGITDSAPIMPLVSAGRVRILAQAEAKRMASKPGIPTIAESGLSGYEVSPWIALFAPAATPADLVQRLNGEVGKMFESTEMRDRMIKAGLEPEMSGPEAMAKILRDDLQRYGNLISKAGLRTQ